jgi:hypothetical protein
MRSTSWDSVRATKSNPNTLEIACQGRTSPVSLRVDIPPQKRSTAGTR